MKGFIFTHTHKHTRIHKHHVKFQNRKLKKRTYDIFAINHTHTRRNSDNIGIYFSWWNITTTTIGGGQKRKEVANYYYYYYKRLIIM